MNAFEWIQDAREFGLSATAPGELRSLLEPYVKFGRPRRWPGFGGEAATTNQVPRIRDFVDWEIALDSGQELRHHIGKLRTLKGWSGILLYMLPDFTSLLRNAWDLMSELEGATSDHDLSYISHPSIEDHPQNRYIRDWSILVDLCRDAWVETARLKPDAAQAEFARWASIRYPIFRRLCLFAAKTGKVVSKPEALKLFSEDGSRWLWSVETQHEAIRLVSALARRLDPSEAEQLIELILRGPPRALYKADLTANRWKDVKASATWFRLATFSESGGRLNEVASNAYTEIAAAHPEFSLPPGDQAEFPYFISAGYGAAGKPADLPAARAALADALRERPLDRYGYQDNWRNLLEKHFFIASGALVQLGRERTWPQSAWQDALQFLSDEKIAHTAWYRLHGTLERASPEAIRSFGPSLTWWLQSVAGELPAESDAAFFRLFDKVVADHPWENPPHAQIPLSQAINHPVGHLTEALLRLWYQTKPKVGGLLPAQIRQRFTSLVTSESTTAASRLVLATHLANLYIVDPQWTKEHLLAFFEWGKNLEVARFAWEAYLGNANISAELIAGFKKPFLETARHYIELGDYAKQYAALLALSLVEFREGFTDTEARRALRHIGTDGVAAAAHRIAVGLANAGDRREEHWSNRAKPLLAELWPKSATFRSGEESCALAQIAIYSGPRFEEALNAIFPWLTVSPECRQIATYLSETGVAQRTPAAALRLLTAIVDTTQEIPPYGLATLLNTLEAADGTLADSQAFRALRAYAILFGAT